VEVLLVLATGRQVLVQVVLVQLLTNLEQLIRFPMAALLVVQEILVVQQELLALPLLQQLHLVVEAQVVAEAVLLVAQRRV
jgi:hypothetical protein